MKQKIEYMTRSRLTGLNKESLGYYNACASKDIVMIICTAPIKAVAVSSVKQPQIISNGNIKLASVAYVSIFRNRLKFALSSKSGLNETLFFNFLGFRCAYIFSASY